MAFGSVRSSRSYARRGNACLDALRPAYHGRSQKTGIEPVSGCIDAKTGLPPEIPLRQHNSMHMTTAIKQAHPIPAERCVDFDIHGALGIRTVDAAAGDVAALISQLGSPQPLHDREPDLTIRFQEDFAPRRLTYLGLNSMAFDDDGFYILGRRNGRIKARIPFDEIGEPCEILCQRGIGAIPLLYEIINLILLKKAYIPLHASAFHYQGKGILVMGWTKGGKTESLLSFANHGASYVGDEAVVVSSDGRAMFGLPIPITMWDWQFKDIPNLLPPISAQKKFLLKSLRGLEAIHHRADQGRLGRLLPFKLLSKAMPTLARQRHVTATPQTLFGDRVYARPAPVDKLFLALSHNTPEIRIEACEPKEIAQRMRSSNEAEQMHFFEHYKAFRYAFPQAENKFLDDLNERQNYLIHQALAGKQAYKVYHPYPVSFEALFTHMQPYCE